MKPTLDNSFNALADPTRRAILQRLAFGDASVSQLALPYRMTMQAVSKHLRVLEKAGFVTKAKSGRERRIALKPEALQDLHTWIGDFAETWEKLLKPEDGDSGITPQD